MSSPLTEDLTFSPDDYDDNPDQEDEEGGSGQKKRKQVKRACFSCRKAHARCDEERPCRRCIRTGCEVTCVDVPRKKRVLKKPMKEEKLATGLKRGRRRRIDESGEGCESGGESDSKNFYFDVGDDEVLEGGSFAGKTTPLPLSTAAASSKPTPSVLSASISSVRKFDFSSIAIDTAEDLKLSWKDSLLDSMTFAHNSDDTKASSSSSTSTTTTTTSTASQQSAGGEEETEFCFDLGKSSDDERCLEEIPQEMVRELTELRSYNSTLQDMIKDVQQFNSYQRKKRRQWELSKLNGGAGAAVSGLAGAATTAPGGAATATTNGTAASGVVSLSAVTAAPSDALPQWLVSDFSSLSNKLVDLSADPHSSGTASSSSSAQAGGRGDDHQVGDLDYLGAWQQLQHGSSSSSSSSSLSLANHGAPLQLPTQLALLAGQPHSMSQLLSGHQQQQSQLPVPHQLQQQQQQQQQAQTQHQQPPRPAPQNANSNNEASAGPAPFTTSLPFTEV